MPAKLRDITKVLRKSYGINSKPGGKHMHLMRDGARDFPLPHRDELSNGYIKDMCEHFGIDPEDFWAKLRG